MPNTQNQSHWILTTNGTDGACAAAMILQRYPKAQIITTSAQRIAMTLEEIVGMDPLPGVLHLCGVGVYENIDSVMAHLRVLKKKRIKIFWYCGRGYLDEYHDLLASVCVPVFLTCASNTEAVYQHLQIENNDLTRMLLALAHQFVNRDLPRSEKDTFWHDLVAAGASRYFKYEDKASYIHVIQKLAGLIPLTEADGREAEAYRQEGRFAIPLGNSKAMKRLRTLIARLGPVPEPVLVLGPTGSGKEIAARLLHEASGRPGPFIAVNCAILSTNADLAHDRLFGHVAGAYTGARETQPGAFSSADGGTLFLDEVAELPMPVQTQLLRVLEEQRVTPLGTMKSHPVDVRVIAATNRDLLALARNGAFRMDLYHRLNVLLLRVPSLKEHQEDLPSIARSHQYELKNKGYPLNISQADWDAIYAYDWPGNIRQFINLLRRAAYMKIPVREVLAEETGRAAASNGPGTPDEASLRLFRPVSPEEAAPEEEIRKSYIQHVYRLCGGNITQAAGILRVAKGTVRHWVKHK
ncbi:MAG TPA: sigma 54-interacting transcriptional regulator [bacterium]|nr:sigma 54-interacting transcriptional regulator [bacterium]